MDREGWIDISLIASFNRMQRLTSDLSLVRDTMMISSLLEVRDDKVRLTGDRWKEFIIPSSLQSHSSSSSIDPRASAAYSLANTLSGLEISGDDAATIQAKVTAAVLGTKSSMFQVNGNGKLPEVEKDESASNTTTGSALTDATPGAATSPPTSDAESEKRSSA